MTERCLDCHQPLKAEITRRVGLHGQPGFGECQKCHVEHQGRDYDLIWWENGQENFDHRKTGYLLEGAHSKTACRTCHQPKNITLKDSLVAWKVDLTRTFLGLDTNCITCHIDEHRGQVRSACRDCHSLTGWKPAPGFDHSKTRYPLTGAHAGVVCAKCHPSVVDNRSSDDKDFLRFTGLHHDLCTDCHRDVHDNKLGSTCDKCHTTTGWKTTNRSQFDHDRTNYPLTGMHSRVACERCHKPGQPLRGLKFGQCRDCHPDYHKGEFAARPSKGACEECHTVTGFSPARFTLAQHDQTSYPLRGAHVAVSCNACHKRPAGTQKGGVARFDFQSTRCIVCHPDPHKPRLDKLVSAAGCEFCHVDDAWDQVHFDHDKTDYHLVGRHRELRCRSCHHSATDSVSGRRVDFTTLGTTCAACHRDIHHGQFRIAATSLQMDSITTDCTRCHTPKSWLAEKFNHDTDAAYKLEGAHRRVPCSGCHKAVTVGGKTYVTYKPLDTSCRSCHSGAVTKEGLNKG